MPYIGLGHWFEVRVTIEAVLQISADSSKNAEAIAEEEIAELTVPRKPFSLELPAPLAEVLSVQIDDVEYMPENPVGRA